MFIGFYDLAQKIRDLIEYCDSKQYLDLAYYFS